MKIFIRLVIIIAILLMIYGCSKSNILSHKNQTSSNISKLNYPIDLNQNRENFLYELQKANTPETKELLRQYLFDNNPKIAKISLNLLKQLDDKPSLVERYVLQNPSVDKKDIEKFLKKIETKEVLQEIVFHTLTKKYRSELKEVDLYKSQKRIEFKEHLYENSFSFKNFICSGGQEGIFEEDKLTIKENLLSTDSGWRSISKLKDKKESDEKKFYKNKPFIGAWTKFVSNTSCPPVCADGLYYMSDGIGNLICGDLESDKIIWKTPFPAPPFAQVIVVDDCVTVKFESDIENYLIAQFNTTNGFLTGLSIERKIQFQKPFYKNNNLEVTFQYQDNFYLMTSKSNEKTNWEQKIFCTPKQFWVSEGVGFLLGEYRYQYYAFGAFDLKSGKPIWCLPIRSGENLKYQFQTEKHIWLMDSDSIVICIEKTTGKTIFNIRISDKQYSSAATCLAMDNRTSRIIIDPSNGAIYSMPINAIIETFGLKTSIDDTATFAETFQLEVFVKKINKSFNTKLKEQNTKNSADNDDTDTFIEPKINLDNMLFAEFANTFQEAKFSDLTTRNWFQNWIVYENKLIEKAKSLNLEYKNLEECLHKIRPKPDDEVALIPVNAFDCIVEDKPCWVIVCKWEYNQVPKDEKHNLSLSHVKMWAISKDDKKIIGYSTCN